ncbi:MAG: phosphoribosylformylglycinamidine synthase subunit PurQ [Armatimonadota bacterium]|nr:phosphoribosylformylglycinamidine synthase subunit PurQ [Armatimonadota bacterium]
MKFGVIVFPGSNCDADSFYAVRDVLKQPVDYIWHQSTDLKGSDCIIVPGGFSYGDYLRTGAVARFSPVMSAVEEHANRGGLLLGICNGFQILCEAHLLPGVLTANTGHKFICRHVNLRVEHTNSAFTKACSQGQVLRIPIAHGEGNYYCDADTLARLEGSGQILFRYCDEFGNLTQEANPNGSLANIAGIMNERGNVAGMMPHPERAAESILGSEDGKFVLESLVSAMVKV